MRKCIRIAQRSTRGNRQSTCLIHDSRQPAVVGTLMRQNASSAAELVVQHRPLFHRQQYAQHMQPGHLLTLQLTY